MLHQYRDASSVSIALAAAAPERAPGWELLTLLRKVNRFLESTPYVYRSAGEGTVLILYRDVAFLVSEFWESFGLSVATIDKAWPLCIYGTAKNQETVCLSSRLDGAHIRLRQQSLSGKSADVLESLCFQLDCGADAAAEPLTAVLRTIHWHTGVAAMAWKDADFLREQKLLLYPKARGLFCYAGAVTEQTAACCLQSLGFVQKLALWTAFLRDGFEPIEFEWLADEISENDIANRLEWELALWEALDRLHFRIVNEEKRFALFDEAGKPLYFGADGRHAPQRVLIKLLFPLND